MSMRERGVHFFHHLTAATACLTGALVVLEWLIPGFVLPYVPIWPFAAGLALLLIVSPER